MSKKICEKCGKESIEVPVLIGHNTGGEVIGGVRLKNLNVFNNAKDLKNSHFEMGFIENQDGSAELLEISLCFDKHENIEK